MATALSSVRSRVVSIPATLDISRGSITGMTLFDKFGRNPSISTTNDPQDVWNGSGLYTGQPTGAAETIDVFSSSAVDTSAGTGLRTVRLFGQLAGVEQTEDVILNGITKVTTTKTWDRMYRVRGLTAGTGGSNAGSITCQHTTTTANIFAVVPAGTNRSQIAAYTVPLGKTFYVKTIDIRIIRANGSAGSATVGIMVRENGGIYEQVDTLDISTSGAPVMNVDYSMSMPALTDFIIRVLSVTDNNTSCTSHIDGILIDD